MMRVAFPSSPCGRPAHTCTKSMPNISCRTRTGRRSWSTVPPSMSKAPAPWPSRPKRPASVLPTRRSPGGTAAADAGTLAFMVGCDEADFVAFEDVIAPISRVTMRADGAVQPRRRGRVRHRHDAKGPEAGAGSPRPRSAPPRRWAPRPRGSTPCSTGWAAAARTSRRSSRCRSNPRPWDRISEVRPSPGSGDCQGRFATFSRILIANLGAAGRQACHWGGARAWLFGTKDPRS